MQSNHKTIDITSSENTCQFTLIHYLRQPTWLNIIIRVQETTIFEKKMKFILLAICLFGLAHAGKIKVSDCGSKTGVIESVDVSNCDSTPCTLKKGEDATLNLKFTSCNNSLTRNMTASLCINIIFFTIAVDTSKLTSQINGIKFGVPRKNKIWWFFILKWKISINFFYFQN